MIIYWSNTRRSAFGFYTDPGASNVRQGVQYYFNSVLMTGTYTPTLFPISQGQGTVPNVAGALTNWFQPMKFTIVTKTIVNAVVVETASDMNFRGVWQPFGSRQLSMKPEGQRQWSWYTCHSDIALGLIDDDVVTYLGIQYRVMEQSDFALYGYYEYHLVRDYVNAGPS